MARILIADDDVDICDLLEFKLTRAGHQVVVARDGAQAWKVFLADDIDLVVLDCRMPHLTGQQVLTSMRADSRAPGVPVIMMSADADELVIAQAHLLGADAFLVKPFSLAAFSEQVAVLLHRSAG